MCASLSSPFSLTGAAECASTACASPSSPLRTPLPQSYSLSAGSQVRGDFSVLVTPGSSMVFNRNDSSMSAYSDLQVWGRGFSFSFKGFKTLKNPKP